MEKIGLKVKKQPWYPPIFTPIGERVSSLYSIK